MRAFKTVLFTAVAFAIAAPAFAQSGAPAPASATVKPAAIASTPETKIPDTKTVAKATDTKAPSDVKTDVKADAKTDAKASTDTGEKKVAKKHRHHKSGDNKPA